MERHTNIAQTVERRPTKSAETVEQASKIGGRWLVIKRFAFIRVIRGQKRFQKLQKPRNRANLSEFQNLRSRPGSELPKKMLTPWLSNS